MEGTVASSIQQQQHTSESPGATNTASPGATFPATVSAVQQYYVRYEGNNSKRWDGMVITAEDGVWYVSRTCSAIEMPGWGRRQDSVVVE